MYYRLFYGSYPKTQTDIVTMTRIYDKHILKVLMEVGQAGISVKKLSMHVFNMSSTLFESPNIDDVRYNVRLFIMRNSKPPKPLVEKTGKWGCYRLNKKCEAAMRQLLLDFADEATKEKPQATTSHEDKSLNLFE